MYILMFIYLILAFVAFVPGMLFTLPIKGSKLLVTFAHGTLFALVWCLLHKFLVTIASKLNINIGGDMMEGLDDEEDEDAEEFDNKSEEEDDEPEGGMISEDERNN